MAYFAKLGVGNIVKRVEVVLDNIATTENLGIDFLKNLYNEPHGIWIQTSPTIRKNFASIEYWYDTQRDAFIPPKPYNSWILNEQTCNWESPISVPTDGQKYQWNEQIQNWELING